MTTTKIVAEFFIIINTIVIAITIVIVITIIIQRLYNYFPNVQQQQQKQRQHLNCHRHHSIENIPIFYSFLSVISRLIVVLYYFLFYFKK